MLSAVHNLTSTAGIVAMAAGAAALVALLSCAILGVKLRRLRAAQRAILGGHDQDLVAHAASLQQQFEKLKRLLLKL